MSLAVPPRWISGPAGPGCVVAVIVARLPRESPMSTAIPVVPCPARWAARQPVLLALAMSSATPIDGGSGAARGLRHGVDVATEETEPVTDGAEAVEVRGRARQARTGW